MLILSYISYLPRRTNDLGRRLAEIRTDAISTVFIRVWPTENIAVFRKHDMMAKSTVL